MLNMICSLLEFRSSMHGPPIHVTDWPCVHLSIPLIDAETNPELRQVFGAYCRFTVGVSRLLISEACPAMVAQQLHKLCHDVNLIGENGAYRGEGGEGSCQRENSCHPDWGDRCGLEVLPLGNGT